MSSLLAIALLFLTRLQRASAIIKIDPVNKNFVDEYKRYDCWYMVVVLYTVSVTSLRNTSHAILQCAHFPRRERGVQGGTVDSVQLRIRSAELSIGSRQRQSEALGLQHCPAGGHVAGSGAGAARAVRPDLPRLRGKDRPQSGCAGYIRHPGSAPGESSISSFLRSVIT